MVGVYFEFDSRPLVLAFSSYQSLSSPTIRSSSLTFDLFMSLVIASPSLSAVAISSIPRITLFTCFSCSLPPSPPGHPDPCMTLVFLAAGRSVVQELLDENTR